MGEEKIMDQAPIAESVAKKINYNFIDTFLVKPLDPIKVNKEFTKIPDAKPKADENGIEAIDYDKVETEVKEVESDFRKGIVLKVPYNYNKYMEDEKSTVMPIKVGDIVVYRAKYATWFDLLRDTHLVKQFDIVATEDIEK